MIATKEKNKMTEQNISKKLDEAFKNGMVAELKADLAKATTYDEISKVAHEAIYQFNRCHRNLDMDGMKKFLDIQKEAVEALNNIK